MAGLMATTMVTGNEFIIPRRRSSMHRLDRRASVSFSPPSFLIPKRIKGIASRRLPSVQAELIWAAVASNAVCYELTDSDELTDSAGTMCLDKKQVLSTNEVKRARIP
jgi:hypothetical protein